MGAVIHRGVSESFEGYEIFKKYEFENIKLGVGATCQVHEATNISNNHIHAVKIIVKEEAELGGRTTEALRTEAELMGKLKHPNICQFFEIFEDKELMYIVLEMCSGGTLFEKLEHDIVLEEAQAKKMCKEMFKAVGHLHDKGFIHRDLRPESWMLSDLSDEAEIKLSNFRMAVECAKDGTVKQPCGTLHYVAPEVLRGDYGREADTWTLGCVLFLVVYGSYPYDGDSAESVMHAIMGAEPDWSDSCYTLSHELKELLKRLLVKDPKQRMTIDQCLKHVWLPKGQNSRPNSRRGSIMDHLLGRKRNSSHRNSGIRKINIVEVQPSGHSTVPELKAKEGSVRRPSAMVTDDLIKLLEKEAERQKAGDVTRKQASTPAETPAIYSPIGSTSISAMTTLSSAK